MDELDVGRCWGKRRIQPLVWWFRNFSVKVYLEFGGCFPRAHCQGCRGSRLLLDIDMSFDPAIEVYLKFEVSSPER